MRPQRRQAPHRGETGTLPALERQPRRPPHLGTATARRINPRTNNAHTGAAPETATPDVGVPAHGTSEYLRGWRPSRASTGSISPLMARTRLPPTAGWSRAAP